jgi:hypothetical protein
MKSIVASQLLIVLLCVFVPWRVVGDDTKAEVVTSKTAALFAPYPITGGFGDRSLFHIVGVLRKRMHYKVDLLLPPSTPCKVSCVTEVYTELGMDSASMPHIVQLTADDPRLSRHRLQLNMYNIVIVQGHQQYFPEYEVKGGASAVLVFTHPSVHSVQKSGPPQMAHIASYEEVIVTSSAKLAIYSRKALPEYEKLRLQNVDGPAVSIVPNVLNHMTTSEMRAALQDKERNNLGYVANNKPFQIAMIGPMSQQLASIKQAILVFAELHQRVEKQDTDNMPKVKLVILGNNLKHRHMETSQADTFADELTRYIDGSFPDIKKSVKIIPEPTGQQITKHLNESNMYWNYLSANAAYAYAMEAPVATTQATSKPAAPPAATKPAAPPAATKPVGASKPPAKPAKSAKPAGASMPKSPAKSASGNPFKLPLRRLEAVPAAPAGAAAPDDRDSLDTYEYYHLPLAEAMSYGCVPVSFKGSIGADFEILFDSKELDAVRDLRGGKSTEDLEKAIAAVKTNGYLAESSGQFAAHTLRHILIGTGMQRKLRENAIKSVERHSLTSFEDSMYTILSRMETESIFSKLAKDYMASIRKVKLKARNVSGNDASQMLG